MSIVFADTSYWVALIDSKDQWHEMAGTVSKSLGTNALLTTDEILTEVLAFFSAYSPQTRQRVSRFVLDLIDNTTYVDVVEQSRESFMAGIALYAERLDKSYSLVDCVSMQLMKAEAITHALTTDHHFTQEGSQSCSRSNLHNVQRRFAHEKADLAIYCRTVDSSLRPGAEARVHHRRSLSRQINF